LSTQPGAQPGNALDGQEKTDSYLDISFKATWDYIPVTKSYIENILLIEMSDMGDIHKIGTAASELLENATKYSTKKGIRTVIKKLEDKDEIELIVYNYSDKIHADQLIVRVEEMNKTDSLQYYLYRMKESIKNKNESPGLGLARVYHEANAKLSASYLGDLELVEVKANIKL